MVLQPSTKNTQVALCRVHLTCGTVGATIRAFSDCVFEYLYVCVCVCVCVCVTRCILVVWGSVSSAYLKECEVHGLFTAIEATCSHPASGARSAAGPAHTRPQHTVMHRVCVDGKGLPRQSRASYCVGHTHTHTHTQAYRPMHTYSVTMLLSRAYTHPMKLCLIVLHLLLCAVPPCAFAHLCV